MKAFIIGSVTSSKHDIINAERMANSFKYITSRPIFPGENGGDLDKIALITRAIELIHESDLVVVVPKPDGTYGDGTLYEWSLAKFWRKEIVIWDVRKDD